MGVLEAYLGFCRRYAWRVLAGVGFITLIAVFLASQLRIEADITRLLPESAPSVAGLERLKEAYGGQIGRLTVVLEAERPSERPSESGRAADSTTPVDAKILQRLAERLAQNLRGIEGVDRVQTKRPLEFFRRHRLLYADIQDLRDAQEYLDERINTATARANPLFVNLGDVDSADDNQPSDPPALLDPERLAEKYEILAQTPYFISDDGRLLAIFIYPGFPASDLDRSERLVEKVEQVVAAHLATIAPERAQKINFGLTGRYKKRVDLESMLKRDLAMSTSLALGILLVFLLLFLRSVRATLLVLVPLMVGTIWTFAWAELTFGSLNIMTAFLGAVLMGLGVDYGIHLYSRFHELSRHRAAPRALLATMTSTGRANLFAAATTMVALGSLMVSGFRAFFEFGVIALGGLPLILIAYLLLFPCAVGLAERRGMDLTASRFGGLASQGIRAKIVAWIESGAPRTSAQRIARLGHFARIALVALVIAAAVGLPQLQFVRTFSILQSTSAPSWELDERINAMLGQSQTPSVVLTDSAAAADRVVRELQRRQLAHPDDPVIDQAISLSSFVPEDQRAKFRILADLRNSLRELPEDQRHAKFPDYIAEITRVLRGGEVGARELPSEIRRQFSRIDSPQKGVVLVFPAIDLSTLEAIDAWSRALDDLPGVDPERGYDAISEAFLLRDIIRTAERDAVWMLAITLAGLLILSVLALRNFTLTLLQMGVLALVILVGLGINGLVGADFNFMNIVALPIWLGLGVDATFHVLLVANARLNGNGAVDESQYLRSHIHLFSAIAAAYLTSMIGFGTLLIARHDGLFSLGMVAVFGLGSILLVNLLVQITLVAESARPLGQPADRTNSPSRQPSP
jgi:predicted RND superfamily exporter protein